MAAAKAKKAEEVVDQKVDLKPMEDKILKLEKLVSSLSSEVEKLKKAPKSSGGSSDLARELIEALKEMTGPSTKGVRNFIRSTFK